MKKLLLGIVVALGMLVTTNQAWAQYKHNRKVSKVAPSQKNVFKINLVSVGLLTASGFYERALTPHLSAQMGIYFTGLKLWEVKYRGFGLTPELRYYFEPTAPRGLYVSGFGRLAHYSVTTQVNITEELLQDFGINTDNFDVVLSGEVRTRFTTYGVGAAFGGQVLSKKGFVLDIFAGPTVWGGTFNFDANTDVDIDFAQWEDWEQIEEIIDKTAVITEALKQKRGFNYSGIASVGFRIGFCMGFAL